MHAHTWSQPETLLHELFGPDYVLPEQFYGPTDNAIRLSGERALMWAVFADGIDTYRRSVRQATQRERIDLREVERWISKNDWEWVFSFVNLCAVFGFDANAVRSALGKWKLERHATPVRRRRFRPVALHAAA
jgi:hypothetical protein